MQRPFRFSFIFFCCALAGLLSLGEQGYAQQLAPNWVWARQPQLTASPTTAGSVATATVLLPSRDSYTAYHHAHPLVVGSVSYDSSATLVRHNALGQPVMALATGKSVVFRQLKTDAQNNLYAVGWFADTLDLFSQRLTSNGTGRTYFVAKWNAAGVFQWAQQGTYPWMPTTSAINIGLGIDQLGRVTVAGMYYDTFAFAGQSFPASPNAYKVFAVQLSAAGNVNWVANSIGTPGEETFSDLDVAADGTCYLTGIARGFSWNGTLVPYTPPTPSVNSTPFWLKLNSSGQVVTSKRFGSPIIGSTDTRIAAGIDGISFIAIKTSSHIPIDWDGVSITNPDPYAGVALLKLNASGVPQWLHHVSVADSNFFQQNPIALVAVSDLGGDLPGRLYLTGNFGGIANAAVMYNGLSQPSTSGAWGAGFLLSVDQELGTGRYFRPVASSSGGHGKAVAVSALPTGEVLVAGTYYGPQASFGTLQLTRSVTGGEPYVAELAERINLTQGVAYRDLNANALLDTGEPGYGGLIVERQPGNDFTSTNAAGEYSIASQLGTMTYSLSNPPLYHTLVTTGSPSVSFTNYNNVASGPSFALQPVANQQDLQVFVTPISRARPGFALTYRLTAHNLGTKPVSAATLQLAFDPLLSFVSSTTPVTGTGTTLSMALGTLQPGETRNVEMLFQIAITTPVNHNLTATATLSPISGDLTPADNVETSNLIVTGSYDPNDIAVNYPTLLLPDVQNGARPLDYTVRFQNIGTDTAFSVVLRDTLPADLLYLGTLQVLAASHTCTWRLGTGGVLTVSFPNIRLPHRTANTLRSMGFVRFRLYPYTTLSLGNLIPNKAGIYFDYNAPVITNTALTTVVNPTGLTTESAALTGGAWPNPATGTLNVALDLPTAAPLTVSLTDAVGRAVQTTTAAATAGHFQTTLDVTGLTPGLYLLRAQIGGRGFSQRVVVR
jgi:Secretion system C-terminal sorting domain/Domain of unknown function DUF11